MSSHESAKRHPAEPGQRHEPASPRPEPEQDQLRQGQLRQSRAGAVLQWQRQVGNRVVAAALTRSAALAVQRQPAPQTTAVPVRHVDEVTFPGFLTWLSQVGAAVAEARTDAATVTEVLPSPYRDRLVLLVEEVERLHRWVGTSAGDLAEGRPAPFFTAWPASEWAVLLERRLSSLWQVTEAWQAVHAARLWELLARFGEADLRRAELLEQELSACIEELMALNRIAEGRGLEDAFTKLGVNAAITGAGLAITFLVPGANVALAVALVSAAGGLTVDRLLGGPDGLPSALTTNGASVAGAFLTRFAGDRETLRLAGQRLGAIGGVAGHVSDAFDSAKAIREYEAVRPKLVAVGNRLARLSRELARLEPLLAYPQQAQTVIAALRSHAVALRANAQIVLQDSGQL